MPDATGQIKGIAVPRVPWQEDSAATPDGQPSSDDPLYVDTQGHQVDEYGEPLSQEDYDNRPKGV